MVEVMKKVSGKYEENAKVARKNFPGAVVLDVTIDGLMGKLDPGFRWEKVGVPGMFGKKGLSLKGVWEGLKVFRKKNEVDEKWWSNERFLGKERKCKSYGNLMGWKIGDEVMEEDEAKERFGEIYRGMVEERYGNMIRGLRSEKRTIVLLDYMEGDERKMIEHARILKEMIEKRE